MSRKNCICSLNLQFWLNIVIAVVVIEMVVVLLSAIGLHLPHWVYANVRNFSIGWSSENLSGIDVDPGVDESASSFLFRYKEFCKKNYLPAEKNIEHWQNQMSRSNSSEVCDCLPTDLVGGFPVNFTATPPVSSIVSLHPELAPGGLWAPSDCIPRQRVALIIPFRDREEHLQALLYVLHPFLQRQMLDYTIFVVEQAEPEVFNKAMLMNAGFSEASKVAPFDCYIFHDVDMLPEDDRNFYVCSSVPRHVGAFVDKWEYKIPYAGLFGGVTAFTKAQFELVNGFSNQFYGWGGEDDDMLKRIEAKNLKITRFPRSVARFNMIRHAADARNPYNIRSAMGWRFRPAHYATDGLNTLVYTQKAVELRPLYYWLFISLPPPPHNFKAYSRTYRALSAGSAQPIVDLTAVGCAVFVAVLPSLFS